jgi:hypothetical protein
MHIMGQNGDGRDDRNSDLPNEHVDKSSNETRLDDFKSLESRTAKDLERFTDDNLNELKEPFVIDTDLNKDTDEEIIEKIIKKAEQRKKSLSSTFHMANVDGVVDSNSDTSSISNNSPQEDLCCTDTYNASIQLGKENAGTKDYDTQQTAFDINRGILQSSMTKFTESLINLDNHDAENYDIFDNDEEQATYVVTANNAKKNVKNVDLEQELTNEQASQSETTKQITSTSTITNSKQLLRDNTVKENQYMKQITYTIRNKEQKSQADSQMKKTEGRKQSSTKITDVMQGQNHLHLKDIKVRF